MPLLSEDNNRKVSQVTSFFQVANYSVVVGTTEVPVKLPARQNDNRMVISIKSLPTNTNTVYVGATGLTVLENSGTGGYPVAPGESVSLDIALSDIKTVREIYAISDAAGQELRVLEV